MNIDPYRREVCPCLDAGQYPKSHRAPVVRRRWRWSPAAWWRHRRASDIAIRRSHYRAWQGR